MVFGYHLYEHGDPHSYATHTQAPKTSFSVPHLTHTLTTLTHLHCDRKGSNVDDDPCHRSFKRRNIVGGRQQNTMLKTEKDGEREREREK